MTSPIGFLIPARARWMCFYCLLVVFGSVSANTAILSVSRDRVSFEKAQCPGAKLRIPSARVVSLPVNSSQSTTSHIFCLEPSPASSATPSAFAFLSTLPQPSNFMIRASWDAADHLEVSLSLSAHHPHLTVSLVPNHDSKLSTVDIHLIAEPLLIGLIPSFTVLPLICSLLITVTIVILLRIPSRLESFIQDACQPTQPKRK